MKGGVSPQHLFEGEAFARMVQRSQRSAAAAYGGKVLVVHRITMKTTWRDESDAGEQEFGVGTKSPKQ
jgi:hypothetical protein